MAQLKKYIIIFQILFLSIGISVGKTVDDKKTKKYRRDATLFYTYGLDFGQKGKLDSALFYAKKAAFLYENHVNDSILLANTYQTLGIINKLLGNYKRAIEYYNKSEDIYISKKQDHLIAYIYNNKVNIYFKEQDYAKAQDYQQRAIAIFNTDTVRFKKQLANGFNNLGNIYKRRLDFKTAVKYYNKSLQLYQNKNESYLTYGNLALCYNNLNNHKIVENYYNVAIENARSYFGDKNIKLALQYLNYGECLQLQSKHEKSLKYIYKALEIYMENFGIKHPDISRTYRVIGNYFLINEQMDSALVYYQKSLIALAPEFNDSRISSNPEISQVFSKTHLLKSLKNKAKVLYLIADKRKSIKYYNLSLETYAKIIEVINDIRSGYLNEDSKLFLAENEFEFLSKAVRASFELFKLTNDKYYIAQAFKFSEASKSAILIEAINNSQTLNLGGIPDSLINNENQLKKSIWNYERLIYEESNKKVPSKNNLDYWRKNLFEEKRAYASHISYLENNFPEYLSLRTKNNNIRVQDLQDKLSANESIIEFFIAEKNLYTFLIQKEGAFLYKFETDSILTKQINIFRKANSEINFSQYGNKEFLKFQESSFYIYDRIFAPIRDKIKNSDLIIIPDGILCYLPFESLTTANKNFQFINYRKLPYFIYDNSISYLHSAKFMLNKYKTKAAGKEIGAFAPLYANDYNLNKSLNPLQQKYRERLLPIAGIKEEVLKVTELLDGDKFIDTKANEKKFKEVAPSYDILHLAMHTIINDRFPMYSKMAFTQSTDNTEDGLLNTYELYNLKLNCRMAVLSACNTGNGKIQRGEGVLSLARGFLYAGCPSIVMTLWSVEDNTGVNLMTSFYKNLVKGKTKAGSLRASKLEFIAGADQIRAHPHYWAGYVVIGNNDPLYLNYSKYLILLLIPLLATGLYLLKKRRDTI